ncbi:MAG: DUF5830 family protein [Candidatus Hydrothermarchaeota archaeon]
MDVPKSILKERCMKLLSIIDQNTIPYSEFVNLLELVTFDLEVKKEVIREAQEKGIIKKEGKHIIFCVSEKREFEPKIIKRELENKCRRCGRRIKNCYYIEFSDGRLGPFGSSCIKKSGLSTKI